MTAADHGVEVDRDTEAETKEKNGLCRTERPQNVEPHESDENYWPNSTTE